MSRKSAQKTTIVSVILDRSGSMDSIRNSVIDSFNEYISGLQTKKGKVILDLTLFDAPNSGMKLEKVYSMVPLDGVKKLTKSSYVPRGMTPLYDAALTVIEELESKVSEMANRPNLMVAIITDGLENASRKYNKYDMEKTIKELEGRGNWTFVYMGANQDSASTVADFASGTYFASNTLDWEPTSTGLTRAFSKLRMATNEVKMYSAKALNVSAANVFSKSQDDGNTSIESKTKP